MVQLHMKQKLGHRMHLILTPKTVPEWFRQSLNLMDRLLAHSWVLRIYKLKGIIKARLVNVNQLQLVHRNKMKKNTLIQLTLQHRQAYLVYLRINSHLIHHKGNQFSLTCFSRSLLET